VKIKKKYVSVIKKKILECKPRNRILYGAPGTGKSNQLDKEAKYYFNESNYERVTFFANYTYSQFVGSFKPVVIYKENNSSRKYYKSDKVTEISNNLKPVITYRFVPGPFIKMLARAQKSLQEGKDESFLLIIEEINRANASAVFGDIFQLLDRDRSHNSQYAIYLSEEIQDYLVGEEGLDRSFVNKVVIPHNLYIWSTMNSSDQGVNPLDTAFKRRWSFEYLALNKNEHFVKDWEISLSFLSYPVSWNKFRSKINERLIKYVPEDKLLGPFFLKEDELKNANIVKNKLLLYLHQDAMRINPTSLFKKSSFYEIVEMYDNKLNIFKDIEF
jgi:hypothetical protein